jgi:hypothetical protein
VEPIEPREMAMKPQRCPVKECGAVVYLLPLAEGEIAVDPQPLEVVVPAGEVYGLVTGFRPHWQTCVDITTRGRHPSPSQR